MTKQHSPAALRNRAPITDVLATTLPDSGQVLEVASGSGEHVIHFAGRFPALTWIPSDPAPEARASIAEHLADAGLPNVQSPRAVDVSDPDWPATLDNTGGLQAIVCINMIHIAPWQACLGLFEGAAQLLPRAAPLYLYGPYRRGGGHTSQSNAAFDAQLKQSNPLWGLRDLETVCEEAEARGFTHERTVEMPANNLSVILRRA
ncbi:DUF938 domain-containing protein [Fodinicurvata halophila]|uniref:DUF938 domain-containing protein n=1 Tax=Fodinicurvata halophila TaxID=1419723 RepID=A0ABV8UHK8_9PROT